MKAIELLPKDNSIPQHDVVFCRCTTDTGRWVFLQPAQNKLKNNSQIKNSRFATQDVIFRKNSQNIKVQFRYFP